MLSDGIITTLLVLAVLAGIGGAAFLVFRSPAFWGDVVTELARKAWPQILEVLTKRNSAEIEQRMAECVRRGGEWDNVRKRCRD